jgi:hypothetical protein
MQGLRSWIPISRLDFSLSFVSCPESMAGMKILLCTLAALLTLAVPPVQARNLSSVDGNVLLTKCHPALQMAEVTPKLSQEEWVAAFYCLGFVQGAMDADAIWQVGVTKALGAKGSPVLLYCAPKDASWPQVIRILMKWLEDNPDKLNFSGYDVINAAMSKAYPCPAP